MAHVILVTGGSRSGKSGHALRLAESLPGPHCFIATCVPQDDEMQRRVRNHQAERDASRWRTVEAPLELPAAIRSQGATGVCLIECLPLWVSNLMARAEERAQIFEEGDLVPRVDTLLSSCTEVRGTVVLVTAEVGLGVVPENQVARRFRDLLGLCNQKIAQQAHSVTLVACGLPLQLKGTPDGSR